MVAVLRSPRAASSAHGAVNIWQLWMVLDYMNRGTCLDQIRGNPADDAGSSKFAGGFQVAVLKWILVKTLHALVYLHKQVGLHKQERL